MKMTETKERLEQWMDGDCVEITPEVLVNAHEAVTAYINRCNRVESVDNPVLTLKELHDIFEASIPGYIKEPYHIFVINEGIMWPAIIDRFDGKIVAVWCANPDEYLYEDTYGTKWTAYRYNPCKSRSWGIV